MVSTHKGGARPSKHSASHRREGADLSTVVSRIGHLEEAYSQLPLWARTPQIQRRWIIACLREIQWACEHKAHREGYGYKGERVRFYHMLIDALQQVESGSRPAIFTKPNEEVYVWQKDRWRISAQAWAAAILDLGQEYCRETSKGEWATKIGAAVSAAGLGGGKSRTGSDKLKEELAGSTVEKWLARCKTGTQPSVDHSAAHRERIRTSDFLAADTTTRARILDGEITKLGDAVRLHWGSRDRRAMNAKNRKYISDFCQLLFGPLTDEQFDEQLGNLGVEFP